MDPGPGQGVLRGQPGGQDTQPGTPGCLGPVQGCVWAGQGCPGPGRTVLAVQADMCWCVRRNGLCVCQEFSARDEDPKWMVAGFGSQGSKMRHLGWARSFLSRMKILNGRLTASTLKVGGTGHFGWAGSCGHRQIP